MNCIIMDTKNKIEIYLIATITHVVVAIFLVFSIKFKSFRKSLHNISVNDITEVDTMTDKHETGALTEGVYYILLSLIQPLHGYGIIINVERLSGERLRLAAGTLYGAINSMLAKGWIIALPNEKDSRKKEYQITEDGKKILQNEIVRLEELLQNGKEVLEGNI